MKRKVGWAAVIVLVGAAGVFLALRSRGEELPQVTVQAVERGDLESRVAANGRIEAKQKVDLSANVMGQIVDLRVEEGDRVEKGELLLQIDQAQLEASAAGAEASMKALRFDRDAARARAAEAKQSYERARATYDESLIPRSELERAEASWASAQAEVSATERRIEQARAALTGARDSLEKTRILAPISGTVTRLPVEEGEVAVVGTMNNPGTILLTISDLSIVEAVMEVDETDVPALEEGQEADVTIDAYANQTFRGRVTEIGSSPIESRSGTGVEAVNFEVKIQLDEPPPKVRPGFSCSAEILTGRREDVLAVPLQALVVVEVEDEEGGPRDEEGVYLLEDGAVRFVAVETGITSETTVEVRSGVEEGQRVVTGPFRVLREVDDGARVTEQTVGPPEV